MVEIIKYFLLIFFYVKIKIFLIFINMSSRYLELAPQNKSSDNTYAFKKGYNQLDFRIPEGSHVLDPHSVRLVGDIRFYKTDSSTPADQDLDDTDVLALNNKLGVYSVINSLIWRSGRTSTTISHEKNWNRWCSSYLAITGGLEDSIGHLSESALTLPNYKANKDSVVCKNEKSSFCVPLICGLLNSGQSIPLTPNTLGSLDLSVVLESDSQALQVLPADFENDPNTADYLSAYYELSNVKLVCSVITPPPDQLSRLLSQKQGAMTYQSIHSFYDTANSNNIQVSMNLGLSKVKSLFINMIASDKLNNIGADGFATLPPTNLDGTQASVEKLTFLRGGTIFPKMFPRNTNVKETTNTAVYDPILFRDYIQAVSKYDHNRHNLGGLTNANRGWLSKVATGGVNKGVPYQLVQNGGVFFGVGLNYDNYLNGTGVDLKEQTFGLSMECDLTSSNAQSIFLFVNAESTILYNESGVQLIN